METDWRAEERVPILRMLTPADVLSLTNGLLGLLAVIAALGDHVRLAFSFIVLAVLFDGLDGAIARLGYGGGRLGPKLDSYSDLVSFVVAPALLFWQVYGHASWIPLLPPAVAAYAGAAGVLLVSAFYFVTGTLRLARFDYLRGGERDDYFLGVTTPGAAVVLTSIALLRWDAVPALGVALITAALMASRVRLPKLRGTMAPAGGVVLLVAALVGDAVGNLGPTLLLTFFLAYLVLGPGYVRRHLDPDEWQPTF